MNKIEYPIDKRNWHPSLIPGPVVLVSTCDATKKPNIAPKGPVDKPAFHVIARHALRAVAISIHCRKPSSRLPRRFGPKASAPRDEFPALERSRILKPVDDLPVWTIVCLFVASRYRNMGISQQLLKAAVSYARDSGASIVEGYPFDLTGRKSPLPGAFVWTGMVSAYRKAGFKEVARRSPTRPIMRHYLNSKLRKTKKAATNV